MDKLKRGFANANSTSDVLIMFLNIGDDTCNNIVRKIRCV
jgi:hypothetical protein